MAYCSPVLFRVEVKPGVYQRFHMDNRVTRWWVADDKMESWVVERQRWFTSNGKLCGEQEVNVGHDAIGREQKTTNCWEYAEKFQLEYQRYLAWLILA